MNLLITVPGTVTNVRAYVYKPTRGSDNLTALVLWDEPQFVVSNYTALMFQNGQRLFPPVSCYSSVCLTILFYMYSDSFGLAGPLNANTIGVCTVWFYHSHINMAG